MSLNVTFVSGASLQFVLRSTWNCWTFESCGYWEKTAQVAWSNVPTAVFVGFYESTTCHARDENGMDVFAVNGSFTFLEPKAIRSVMIGDFSDLARRPSVIYSKCPDDEEHAALRSTDNDASTFVVGGANASGEASGPSSNWNDAIPSTPSPVGGDVASSNAQQGGP